MANQELSHEQKTLLSLVTNALEVNRANFDNPKLKWRRLFSEVLGTFLLVLAGAGGGVVNAVSNGAISRTLGNICVARKMSSSASRPAKRKRAMA